MQLLGHFSLRPRQDRTFLDEIDQLQPLQRTVQFSDSESLNELFANEVGTSWLIPSLGHHLPDLEPFGAEGSRSKILDRFAAFQFRYSTSWLSNSCLTRTVREFPSIILPYSRPAVDTAALQSDRAFSKNCLSGRTLTVKRSWQQPCVRKRATRP